MSLFKHKIKYTIPERLTPAEARERRLTALLERAQRFSQVPNFQAKLQQIQAERSPGSKITKSILTEDLVPSSKKHDRKTIGHKAALIAAALKQFTERDFADPEMRKAYRDLRSIQMGGRQKVSPSGGNKSYYNPAGKDYASTIYGTAARLGQWTALGAEAARMFLNPGTVIPCIQRSVRREVMFATKKAGRGYRVKHRRSWSTGVPC